MDLTNLNAVAKVKQLELKKLNSMTVNEVYTIKMIRRVKTKKYGEKVIIHTEDAQYFLPSRVSEHLLFNYQKFHELSDLANHDKLQLKFLGGDYNDVEFININ